MSLLEKNCVPCEGGVKKLSDDEIRQYLSEVPNWSLNDAGHLIRRFEYKDFNAALEAVMVISNLAEEENHHPDITFGWGYMEVQFYTHAIFGLHQNDFIMAAKCETALCRN